MALVPVTGNALDFAGAVIDAELRPRLFFKPLRSAIRGGLRIGVSTRATLNLVSGAFSAQLEDNTDYEPWMDWLRPGQQTEAPGDRAASRARWPTFNSSGGGPISSLYPPLPTAPIFAELGPPPPGTNVVWIDLTDVTSEGALVYSPERN